MTVNDLHTLNLAYLIGVASSRGTSLEQQHWKGGLAATPFPKAEPAIRFPTGQAEQHRSHSRDQQNDRAATLHAKT